MPKYKTKDGIVDTTNFSEDELAVFQFNNRGDLELLPDDDPMLNEDFNWDSWDGEDEDLTDYQWEARRQSMLKKLPTFQNGPAGVGVTPGPKNTMASNSANILSDTQKQKIDSFYKDEEGKPIIYGAYLDEEGRSGYKDKPIELQTLEWEAGIGPLPSYTKKTFDRSGTLGIKNVAYRLGLTDARSVGEGEYITVASDEAKEQFMANMPSDFSEYDNIEDYEKALQKATVQTIQANPIIAKMFEAQEAEAAAAIQEEANRLSEIYDTTTDSGMDLATQELNEFNRKVVIDPVLNSPEFKKIQKELNLVAGEVAGEMSTKFGRNDSYFLSAMDFLRGGEEDYVPFNDTIANAIETIVGGGRDIVDAGRKGVLSIKQGGFERDSEDLEILNKRLSSNEITENDPVVVNGQKMTVGERKAQLESNIRKKAESIESTIENIQDAEQYRALFKRGDLSDGINFQDIIMTVGQAVPNLALAGAGAMTGNPVITGIGLAGIFAQEYGNNYYSAIEDGLRGDHKDYDSMAPEKKAELLLSALEDGKYANKAEAAAYAVASTGLERLGALRAVKNTARALGFASDAKKIGNTVKSLYRGQGKQVVKNAINTLERMAQGGKTEFLTEGAQSLLSSASIGAQQDAEALFNLSKLDFEGALEEAKAGGIVGAFLPGGGAVLRQSTVELRNTARDVFSNLNFDTNLKAVNNFFNAAEVNLQNKLKGGKITQAEFDQEMQRLEIGRNVGFKVPKDFSSDTKKKIYDLIIDKTVLEEQIAGKDKNTVKEEIAKISEINNEIAKISATEKITIGTVKAIKEGDLTSQINVTITDNEADFKKAAKDNRAADAAQDVNVTGFITEDGKNVVISKERAAKLGSVNTAAHEVLHAALFKTLYDVDAEGNVKGKNVVRGLAAALDAELDKLDPKKIKRTNTEYAARLDLYKKDPSSIRAEEKLTLLADALATGDIVFNENVFTKIGDVLRRVLQNLGYSNIKFDNGRDVYNFIKDYNKSIAKGKFTEAQKRVIKEGAEVGKNIKRFTGPEAIARAKAAKSKAAEGADTRLTALSKKPGFDPQKGSDYQAIGRELVGMTTAQVWNRFPSLDDGKKEELIFDAIERVLRPSPNKQTSADLNWNGKGTFYGFLNGRISDRILDALKQNPDYLSQIDQNQFDQLQNEASTLTAEIQTEITEKPKYKTLSQSKVLAPEAVNAVKQKVLSTVRVLKTRIDAVPGKNASITPIIADIKKQMGKQADIEFKTMLGKKKGNELKNNLLKLKKPILENMTTTWLMQAMPFAVQKSVGGNYKLNEDGTRAKDENGNFIFEPKFTSNWQGQKIDRAKTSTDQQGKTSGPEIVRRTPANKVTEEQFLNYMFKDGEVIRGRKESLAKAMAEEYSFDLINEELQNPDSDIRKAFQNNQELLGVTIAENFVQEFAKQSDRGTVKFSRAAKNTAATFRQMLDLEIQGDIDGAAELFEALTKKDQEAWLAATADLRTDNLRYKQALKKLNVPKNVSIFLNSYFENNSARDNKQAMKEYFDFSMAMIEALPNDLVKALGADFFGAHYRYLNPKEAKSQGAKIKAAINALPKTDSDITLIQAGFGLVEKITKDVLHKEFKTAQEKVDYFLENYGDQVQALNIANKKAIETIVSTAFDVAVKKPQHVVGLLRMLESTTNIGKSLRALTGISDIQMTAASQAVYINKKTRQGYTNKLSPANKAKIESGEIVINENHPNYKEAQQFIKSGSKQTIAQLLRIKGEHATPSSNFNVSIGTEFLTALSQALENPGGLELIKNSLISKINELSTEFNQQLNTKVLSDIQDAKLGSTSDIGDLRLLAIPIESQNAFFDIQGRQTIGRVNRLINTIFSKANVENLSKIQTEQKAINNSVKYSKTTKGISVYDFDDTLAFSKSQVIVKMPAEKPMLDIAARRLYGETALKNKPGFLKTFNSLNEEQQAKVLQDVPGSTRKITPAEFAKDSEKLASQGATFDFSEFNKVVEGTPGPLAPRLKKAIEKFGNKNIFVLTARPAESANAIHAFLKGIGLELPLENIVGLANGAPAAKAAWMVGKVANGYNDFYFVDDHLGNVKAVKDVLNVFDVKGKVQQARVKRSRGLSEELNKMIERNKGVRSETTYSKIKARKNGARKGRFKFFIPYGAEDFRGLTSYTLAGKGKQGEADQKFFEDNLVRPYLRGVAAMEVAKRALKNDFSSLLKSLPGMKRRLGKKIGDTDYTVDQAVRVYLWTQQGQTIPDISKRDQKKLNSLVSKDAELSALANGLQAISKKDQWVEPSEYWIAGSILKDINDIGEKVNRAEYLQEFNENIDIVFDEKNLNKLEAIYGTRYVDALKNSIARMKSGRNRPSAPGKYEQQWLNWVNNSVGTIMFFNRRSAMMQMLSFANFVNWGDNNPLKAGIAFANQPAYWKAWSKIFNSPKLKERRGGLKSDVQEQEIASQAKNSKDKASAVIAYLLKIGFTPTQIADSFAIATGGATFLINRTKTYKKQGLSQAEAEAKAFEDFSAISDETQQSGDPMLISAQQSSHLGRLVLAFQNTPMQYTRLMKKAAQDIANGRGDFKTNMSKILYYGFVQNLIFSSLSNALFALIPGFDDDEPEEEVLDKKTERILNNMLDTILRGSGLTGAVVSTIKNAIMRYQKEEEKGFTADHAYTLLELINVSPPIGSKARKVYNAIQSKKFDGDVMEAQGWDVTLHGKFNVSPNYEVLGSLASAGLNLPLDRALAEVDAISEALDTRNTSYQRLALGLGWRTWDVGANKEEEDYVKIRAKRKRKEEGKKKAAATRKENQEKELRKLMLMTSAERKAYLAEQKAKRSAAAKKAAATRKRNQQVRDSILRSN